jgi:hypothetical protein
MPQMPNSPTDIAAAQAMNRKIGTTSSCMRHPTNGYFVNLFTKYSREKAPASRERMN